MLFRNVPKPAAWPPPKRRQDVWRALAYARKRDPLGHECHVALAIIYLLLLPVAMVPSSIAFGVLAGYAALRLHCTWRCYMALVRDPLGWLILAWVAWRALSLLWSDRVPAGLDELGAFRALATTWLLWPVIERLPWLIGAFLAGVLVQNGVQLAQGLELLGLEPDVSDRLGGLLHPIHAATFCAAALCWHLSATLSVRGLLRWASLAGLLAALAGLVFTGSRGPWIAAAIATPLLVGWAIVTRPAARRPALAVMAVGFLAATVLWPMADELLTQRIAAAFKDLRMSEQGALATSLGQRLVLWEGAWEVFLDEPVIGVGAGDYGAAVGRVVGEDLSEAATHAHSVYMHELATTGLIGAVLLAAVMIGTLLRAFTDREDTAWSLGTPFVLVSWLVAAAFDSYHLNGLVFGLFGFIVAIVIPFRPPRWAWDHPMDGAAMETWPAEAEGSPA